jgi:2-iminobutanoate/2-iminopropanoate deaminase
VEVEPIDSPEAPSPVGPYSAAWRVGSLVFTSGQGAIDSATGCLAGTAIEEQTALVLESCERVLRSAGATLVEVVKVNVFLTDMSYFDRFNRAYAAAFTPPYPARTAVAARLLGRMLVEIECVACIRSRD